MAGVPRLTIPFTESDDAIVLPIWTRNTYELWL